MKATSCASLGFLLFSFSDLGARFLSVSYSVIQILFLVGTFGAITLLFLSWIGIFPQAFGSINYHLHIIRGFLILLSSGCYLYGFSVGVTLAEYYSIVFSIPFFVTLLAAVLLKEPTGISHWLVILIGFVGIIIVLQPGFLEINEGTLVVLLGVGFAAAAVFLIRLMPREESVFLLSFSPQLFFVFATIPFLPTRFTWPQSEHWVAFFLTAAGSSIATALVAAGFSRTQKTASIAPVNYSQIVWGLLFGWLIFDEIPKPLSMLGATIIILAGAYLMHIEARKN